MTTSNQQTVAVYTGPVLSSGSVDPSQDFLEVVEYLSTIFKQNKHEQEGVYRFMIYDNVFFMKAGRELILFSTTR